jgi:hypothetical protein
LLGMLISIHYNRIATFTSIHKALTSDIPEPTQLRLGIAVVDRSHPSGLRVVFTLDDIKYFSKCFTAKLAYGNAAKFRAGADPTAERVRRRDLVQKVCDDLMDVFIEWSGASTAAALDATGLWAWTKPPRKPNKGTDPGGDDSGDGTGAEPDTPDPAPASWGGAVDWMSIDDVEIDGPDEDPEPDPEEDELIVGVVGRRDPDARHGRKTAKNGKEEWFYGYEEHTLVQVPGRGQDADIEPRLIRRFTVTPASTDIVEPSLGLLDRMLHPVKTLLVDRHYSYKAPARWWDALHDRGINQIQDLRIDDHGFTEVDRTRFAAGCAHCPATPDIMAVITRPAPGTNNRKKRMKKFRKRISRRMAFACKRLTRPDRDGKHRVQCPALAGTIGCPLRAGTVNAAIKLGLPIVENPPSADDPEGLPLICTQTSVTITPPGNLRRNVQRYYWGDPEWEREWRKRTYVEGSYGNRKNNSTEALRRGLYRVVGLHWVMLVMALVNCSYNLRMVRNWHDRTGAGNPDHPLLAPIPTTHSVELTPEQMWEHLHGKEAA